MIFGNPVSQAYIRPPSAPRVIGSYRVTQDFGPSSLYLEPSLSWPGGEGIPARYYSNFHKGIDIANSDCGGAVLAAQKGIVRVSSRYSVNGDQMIVIDHGSGWYTAYNHLSVRLVARGARVTKGQKIGTVGSTGNSTACHLHFMVKSDVPDGANFFSNSVGKLRDPWPRLAQNVTATFKGPGINIRSTAGGSTYATTKSDGAIYRASDNKNLGAFSQPRKWGGSVTGPAYTINGVTRTRWDKIYLAGGWRYVAYPLLTLSRT